MGIVIEIRVGWGCWGWVAQMGIDATPAYSAPLVARWRAIQRNLTMMIALEGPMLL